MSVIHQFTPVLSFGDAISDYTLELQNFIRSMGHTSTLFVERCHPKMAHLCEPFHAYKPHRSSDDTFILHFSIGCDINLFVWLARGRKVLIYHNITPHTYFKQVNPVLAAQCRLGRYQLGLFRGETVLALADSEYNRKELDAQGIHPNSVYPIYLDVSKFDHSPRKDLVSLYSDRINWLFVGRLIPNKRVDAILEAFAFYKRWYRSDARLFIVGSWRGFERYLMALKTMAKNLGIDQDVLFTGHVSLEELVTFYRIADVYLSLSEHEGFCVPLLEAMHFGVPIVAYAAGAVPETLKGGGILLHTQSPGVTAEAVDRVLSSTPIRERVLEAQTHALMFYRDYPYESMFMSYLSTVTT